jgi:hypothetical protein
MTEMLNFQRRGAEDTEDGKADPDDLSCASASSVPLR